ncbi:tetratricopeptide repeat protein [Actinoplanes aureus]|uniref:Tetratricopeptide repeat protein n=1 Tax=Actinoplanes aureus TaxID=2792083 RepID=A0A931CJH0_9ACTN|nr:tetratricopeptide repeat protein [Actinoplanes aureus]MBG0566065.1 tetratricopeptide repeat protein [Actinoplanes aureus]
MTVPDPIGDAIALHERALAASADHRYPEAVRLCRRALALLEEHAGAGHPDVANVLTALGTAHDELGDHAAAEACHRRAVTVMSALPDTGGDLLRLEIQALSGLAGNLRRQGRYAAAGEVYEAALAIAAPEYAEVELASIWNEIGILCKFAGRFDDAEVYYRRALTVLSDAYGPDDPRLAGLFHNLAGLAHSRGRAADGEPYARRSLELNRAAFPADHPVVVADEAHLAALLQEQGRFAEAEPLLRRAVDYFAARYGDDHYEVVVNLHNLAAVTAASGALARAEGLYRRALDGKRRTLGPAHPEVGLTLNNLATVLADRGDLASATELSAAAHHVLSAALAPEHPAVTAAAANLAALTVGSAA